MPTSVTLEMIYKLSEATPGKATNSRVEESKRVPEDNKKATCYIVLPMILARQFARQKERWNALQREPTQHNLMVFKVHKYFKDSVAASHGRGEISGLGWQHAIKRIMRWNSGKGVAAVGGEWECVFRGAALDGN